MRFTAIFLTVLVVGVAAANSVLKKDEVQRKDGEILTKDITGNRTVRLVGFRISQQRGQNLCATLVDTTRPNGTKFEVRFPSHSHTTQETTLMNIIYSSASFKKNPYELHAPQFEVVFSIPRNAQGYVTDFTQWYIVSIKLPKADEKGPKLRESKQRRS